MTLHYLVYQFKGTMDITSSVSHPIYSGKQDLLRKKKKKINPDAPWEVTFFNKNISLKILFFVKSHYPSLYYSTGRTVTFNIKLQWKILLKDKKNIRSSQKSKST